MTNSLAHAALLLAFDPVSGKPRTTASLARVVQAAAVGELVIAGRVYISGGKVILLDANPTGDRAADAVLTDVERSGASLLRNILTSADFAIKAGTRPEQIVREDLESLDFVTTQNDGVLHRTRMIATEISPAGALAEQVTRAVTSADILDDPRVSSLIGVLDSFGMLDKVIGKRLSAPERNTVKRIVAEGDFTVALRRAVDELNVP